MRKLEETISLQVARFLKIQYPKVVYRFDVGADIKLTKGQASKFKRLQMEERGYPDLFIAKPSKGFHGLYIELKKDRSEVYKLDGTYKKKFNKKTGKCHILEQHEMHERLRKDGYFVVWGLGFDDTIKKIKEYMR